MATSIALIMNPETFYHQISTQYYTMKKLGSIIDDVLREKNCKKNSSKKNLSSKNSNF